MLHDPQITVLGEEPGARTHRINANSFQQNAITTINGWQYVAYYTENPERSNKPCHVNLARRKVGMEVRSGEWDTLTFEDYDQVVDDGHNTISIGVCKGDGSIHLSFDHHCDQLRYRVSKPSKDPQTWDVAQFTETQNTLPGLLEPNEFMREVSYPRFVNIGEDLLFTYRIGQAGKGSDVLYEYSSRNHTYTYRGTYLTGTTNSPYINGLSYLLGRLHVSWCYRNFVEFPISADVNAHKQQAGPNGPENNFDLNYALSDDYGINWRASNGTLIASAEDRFGERNSIMPYTEGIRVYEIPMGSGILNQEAQAADWDRGFWVLNREKVDGVESWMVYHRDHSGLWKKIVISQSSRPTETGLRAKICVDRQSNIYLILPGNTDRTLSILQGKKEQGYKEFVSIWRGDGYDGEPLVDEHRLEVSDVLSVFTTTAETDTSKRAVVVLDFDLS